MCLYLQLSYCHMPEPPSTVFPYSKMGSISPKYIILSVPIIGLDLLSNLEVTSLDLTKQ